MERKAFEALIQVILFFAFLYAIANFDNWDWKVWTSKEFISRVVFFVGIPLIAFFVSRLNK